MKTLIVFVLVVSTLVSATPSFAANSVAVSTEQPTKTKTERLGWGWKSPRRSVAEVESFYRDYAINVLHMDEAEAEQFVALAWSTADLLGVDLQDGGYGGGFVLILVLFILLVIIGAGFG